MAAVEFEIDPSLSTPLFQQIVDGFEGLIITGALGEGDSLPSVRDFAVCYSVNPNTVSKAYQSLQSMDLVEAQRGLGLKVARVNARVHDRRRAVLLAAEVTRVVRVARDLRASKAELLKWIHEKWEGTSDGKS